MTRDEIQALGPSPEMNALVAEKVMEWEWVDGRGTAGPSYWEGASGLFSVEFEPSTSWGAAGQVVEKMQAKGCVMILKYHFVDRKDVATVIWDCLFDDGADLHGHYAQASTAFEAISKAALLSGSLSI